MSTAAVQAPVRPRRDTRPVGERQRRVARPSSARSEALGSVRLTRRGRLVVFAASLAVAGGAFTMLGAPAASTHTAYHPAKHRVVVQPGQTLWDIAKQVAPGQDPRVVIDEIVDLNALSSAGEIRAGQPLYVPAR
jgi:nucleoid-associated protein YgaU